MAKFGAENASCYVYTFKEGVLSAVAHDLKLRVEKFSLEINDDASVSAIFDATSLRVVCAIKDGVELQGVLSPKDRRDIEATIAKDVINVKKYPEIKFSAAKVTKENSEREIVGLLSLGGRERHIRCQVVKRDGLVMTEGIIHQPDFGIKPFSAMFGTIKIKPDIKVVVSIPANLP